MLGANSLRQFGRVAALTSLLMLTACAAISEGEITHDGQPCNVLCQRWMGIERPLQSSASYPCADTAGRKTLNARSDAKP